MSKDEILTIVENRVDLPGILDDLSVNGGVIDQALDRLVERTDNTLDDMIKASFWPLFRDQMREVIREQWETLDGK